MSQTILQQRAYLEGLKRRKIEREEEQERQGRTPCARCGRTDHVDGRSRLCPFNRHYGAPTQAVVRQQNRQGRRAGQRQLDAARANPNVPRCPHCILPDGSNDACEHHGNAASHLCHAHKTNVDDVLGNIIGPNHTPFVRRCSLKHALRCYGHSRRQRMRAKANVMQEVNVVVDHVRDLSIKAMLFTQHHALTLLEGSEPIPLHFGSQDYIYGVMQLLLGGHITNQNPNLPQDTESIFHAYVQSFETADLPTVQPLPGYSQTYAHMAKTLATAVKNGLAESFEPRCRTFLAFKLRSLIPANEKPTKKSLKKLVSFAYDTLCGTDSEPATPTYAHASWQDAVASVISNVTLGPTPVNLENLTAKFNLYLPVVYGFLAEMEAYNNAATGVVSEETIVDYADNKSCWELLTRLDRFNDLGRRQQNRLVRAFFKMVNHPTMPVRFGPKLGDYLRSGMTTLVTRTREQLSLSRQFLNGRYMIDTSVCFRTTTASTMHVTKMYTLLPALRFTRKFVTLDAQCLARIFDQAGAQPRYEDYLFVGNPVAMDGPNDEPSRRGRPRQPVLSDYQKIKKKFLVFWSSLDFKKPRISGSYDVDVPPEGNKIAFRNLVRTDGHTLEFLCERKSRERLPDLVMSDLDDNDMVEFWSYGVDPGHTVPFTASGFRKKLPSIHKQRILRQIRSLCETLPVLYQFYGSSFTNARFLAYVSKQKVLDEMVNIFAFGGKKYKEHDVLKKIPFSRIPLVMMGSGVFGFTLKGKKRACQLCQNSSKPSWEGRLLVCVVNESFTSQVCCACHTQSLSLARVLDPLTDSAVSLWSVKTCYICQRHWNRDKSAAKNILHLGYLEQEKQPRPEVFTKRQRRLCLSLGKFSNHIEEYELTFPSLCTRLCLSLLYSVFLLVDTVCSLSPS
ncbi:hypothetical protein DM01DRAFT_1370827 [Hesseltinella vesiculosa]|uniref:Cas12f1-like TNB domain-containing protein n=1 Tax=Hesseltinella vesiculosa TaxID=101127 RepID=A0A1X2GUZ9_9FUNG|nr:hypothetical protein DM01DRAFT_1370827 [Hesseltinella vesiculosa]